MKHRWVLALSLVCLACPKMTPPGPPSLQAAPVKVPEGCLADLTGVWVHRDDPTFVYRGSDDGGAVDFAVYRVWPRLDGGPAVGPDAGELPSAQVHLVRTGDGFSGEAVSPATHPSGKTCQVRFVTRVVACADGGLTLESAGAVALGEACETPPRTRSPVMLRHELSRADAGGGFLR